MTPEETNLRKIADAIDNNHAVNFDDAVRELIAAADRLATLEAEIARRDTFAGCDGCSTGDCPHAGDAECIAAQAEIIREQAAQLRPHEHPCPVCRYTAWSVSVETGTRTCAVCDARERARDAETMERSHRAALAAVERERDAALASTAAKQPTP